MGSGKPLSTHHPPQNVPVCYRARVEGGGTNGPPGLPTQPPKVGPTGGCFCHLISGTSNQQGGVQGLVLQSIQAQEAIRVPNMGAGMDGGTGHQDGVLPERLPGAERGQTTVRDRGAWSG